MCDNFCDSFIPTDRKRFREKNYRIQYTGKSQSMEKNKHVLHVKLTTTIMESFIDLHSVRWRRKKCKEWRCRGCSQSLRIRYWYLRPSEILFIGFVLSPSASIASETVRTPFAMGARLPIEANERDKVWASSARNLSHFDWNDVTDYTEDQQKHHDLIYLRLPYGRTIKSIAKIRTIF